MKLERDSNEKEGVSILKVKQPLDTRQWIEVGNAQIKRNNMVGIDAVTQYSTLLSSPNFPFS